jgi:hypothetical protein
MGSVVSLFVVSCVEHITSGFVQPLDIAIVVLYIMIIFASFLIGIIKLSGFKNVRIAELPGKIILREPVKTIILNPGMILFIGFSIALMIRQIIA